MKRVVWPFSVLLMLLVSAVAGAGEIHDAALNGDVAALQAILTNNPESVSSADSTGSLPLHIAALNGHIDAVRLLLEKGAAVSAGDRDNTTPLICAAMRGHMDVVTFLLDHGASITERDYFGNTPFLAAAGSGNAELVTYFLDRGFDINQQDLQGRSALHMAAFRGNAAMIKLLADRGADLQARDIDSMSVLCGAAYSGRSDAVAHLLDLGADVNEAPTSYGHTPLFAAIYRNRVDVARLLMEKGANLEYRNEERATAMHLAAERGTPEIAQLLLDAGMNVDALDGFGGTPLLHAMRGDTLMVNWLIDHGAQVDALSDTSTAPIVNAVYARNTAGMRALIGRGANVNGSGRPGDVPLLITAMQGNEELAAILLDAGADIEVADSHYGRTPLHWSAIRGQSGLASLLLEHGANVSARDQDGHSALYYANRYSNPSVAEVLLSKGADRSGSDLDDGRPTLKRAIADREAVVWYLGHSGWGIKTQNHFLIFDYFEEQGQSDNPCLANGYIDPAEIKDLDVVVFSTHQHSDHYDTTIFDWRGIVPKITYVFGHQPTGRDGYTHMAPRTDQTIGDLHVWTITATDAGVGFLVDVDGLCIFHAGDHANGVPGLNAAYTDEIDYLAGLGKAIDIAFLPILGCSLGTPESVKEGAYYAFGKLSPKVAFPQHSGNASYRYREFADDAKEAGYTLKIAYPDNRGDGFSYNSGTVN